METKAAERKGEVLIGLLKIGFGLSVAAVVVVAFFLLRLARHLLNF